MLLTGRILSVLAVLFLILDGAMKIVKARPAVEGTMQLGYPESAVAPIGAILLLATLLYAVPRTSLWGAILVTGYLGGAVASQFRVGSPLFSNVLFPVYFGVLIWAGLALRDERLRNLLAGSKRKGQTG